MKHVRSLFLRSAASLALFVCAVAARADSIPIVTATSAHYSDVHGVAQWGVSGNSFAFGGEGLPPVVEGSGYPGQSLADFGVTNVPFAASRGPGINPAGTLTLNGVSYTVEPLGGPSIVFSANDIFVPYGDEFVFSAPAVVRAESPIGLAEVVCDPSEVTTHSCYTGNIPANALIDVPGIVTFYGGTHQYSGSNLEFITAVEFTATPEPVSAGLAIMGFMLMPAVLLSRKRRSQ